MSGIMAMFVGGGGSAKLASPLYLWVLFFFVTFVAFDIYIIHIIS